MSVEFRPAREDEMEEFRRLMAYAFAEHDVDPADASNDTIEPGWTDCAFVDGRMAASMAAYPFTVRLNGAPVAMAGVTAAGTYPEFRRRGLLRSLIERSFRQQRERGQSIAILWASMGAIYQRFGYGLASAAVSYDFDPIPRMAFQSGPVADGSVRLTPRDEALPLLKAVYEEYAAPRNLMIERPDALWEKELLPEARARSRFAAVYRNAEGEPRGYVLYRTRERQRDHTEPGQDLTVRDLVALDMDAYRGIWEYLLRHDLVRRVQWDGVPEDDPAPLLLLEPRELNRRTLDGLWLRVVDVERALAQRPYGDGGALTVAIRGDDLCPWNDGAYLIETDGGASQVTASDREPDLVMPPRTLASLISGYASASLLARAGLLEAADERVLTVADRLFATAYRPHCPDVF